MHIKSTVVPPITPPSRQEVKRQLRQTLAALQAQGITQKQIAKMARVTASMVSHYFKGRTRSVRIDEIIQMLLARAARPGGNGTDPQ